VGDAGEDTRARPWRRRLREAGLALLPAFALLATAALAAEGARGRFQAALAAMTVAVAVGAFGAGRAPVRAAARLLAVAVLAGLAHGLLTGDAGGAAATGFLLLAVSVAASGLAALGRRIGTPGPSACAVAAIVLWVAMAGLFWADPAAEHLDRAHRRPFRQAVLHVDPALALAYDGAHFDRLRSEEVYFEVPLASSLYERPSALPTGSLWLAAGLLAWAAALVVRRRGGREGRDAPVA